MKYKTIQILFLVLFFGLAISGVGSTNIVKAAAKPQLNHKKATMYTGATLTLKVKKKKSSSLRWKSSNKKVAIVKNGKVKALKKGKTTIRVKAGKRTLICKINVKSNKLNRKTLTVYKSGTFQMKATKLKKGIIKGWTSQNNSIATVSDNGLVTGISNGTTTISVKLKSETYTCKVQVVNALSRDDFHAEFTDEEGNAFTNFIDYAKYWNYETDYIYAEGEDKSARGIGEGDSISKVFATYGEAKKVNITFNYSVITSVLDNIDLSNSKYYCEYTYVEDSVTYQIRFFFDKKDKVDLLLIAKGFV